MKKLFLLLTCCVALTTSAQTAADAVADDDDLFERVLGIIDFDKVKSLADVITVDDIRRVLGGIDLEKVITCGDWRTGELDSLRVVLGQVPAVNNDVDWLREFDRYRTRFETAARQGQTNALTGHATKLLELCKLATERQLLSATERKTVDKSLKQLKKLTRDDFVKGVLDEARAVVKR